MAADVDALNYPYIRVRNVEWLKKTLLLFPHVARMTPDQEAPLDDPEVRPFCWQGSRQEALLRPANLWAPHVIEAQSELVRQLEAQIAGGGDRFVNRFRREAQGHRGQTVGKETVWERRLSPNSTFQIHRYKMHSELTDVLLRHGLAWEPEAYYSDGMLYLEMSPILGEAVMATLAVACAENEGLQVVTEFPRIHGRLIGTPRDEILKKCLEPPKRSGLTSAEQVAEFIVYRRCDVSGATAEDFAAISHERHALADFRARLEELAKTLPPTIYSEERLEQRLNDLTNDIFRTWSQEQASFGSVGKRMLGIDPLGAPEKLVDKLVEGALKEGASSASGATAGATAAHVAGAGLTIGLATGAAAGFAVAVVFRAINAWRDTRKAARESPLRYLTALQDHGVVFSMTR